MSLDDRLGSIETIIKRDDIRGVYGEAITEKLAYDLGLALAEILAQCTAVRPVNVVVGHDMRLSGPALAASLCAGLDDGGCRAIAMGRAGTELVGFLPAKYSDVIDGGVIITASHNPKDNNGFKFFGRRGAPLDRAVQMTPPCPETQLGRIGLALKKRAVPDRLDWDEFAPDYIRTIIEKGGCDFEAATSGAFEPMRVAVEAGNGMGGRILGEFARITPQFEWTFSNEVPDGNFPVIIPNPLQAAYQQMVTELVKRADAHVGLCFDGDADRAAAADEQGRMIPPPYVTALIGQRLRERLGPETKVAFNLATSWVVPDTLGDRRQVLGEGTAVMTPVGYAKIKAIMYGDPEIGFGAEHSAHYMFREFWCSDSGMLAALLLLEIAAELHAEGKPLSSVLEGPRARYHESGEINFQLPPDRPGDEVIEKAVRKMRDRIERLYVVVDDRVRLVDSYPPPDLELSVADVRAEAADWWFCMRKSGTEAGAGDLLRLYVEADGEREQMEAVRDELVEMVGPDLRV